MPAMPRFCACATIISPISALVRSPPPSTTMTSPASAMSSALWIIRLSPGRVFTVNAGPASAPPRMHRPQPRAAGRHARHRIGDVGDRQLAKFRGRCRVDLARRAWQSEIRSSACASLARLLLAQEGKQSAQCQLLERAHGAASRRQRRGCMQPAAVRIERQQHVAEIERHRLLLRDAQADLEPLAIGLVDLRLAGGSEGQRAPDVEQDEVQLSSYQSPQCWRSI